MGVGSGGLKGEVKLVWEKGGVGCWEAGGRGKQQDGLGDDIAARGPLIPAKMQG
jgi:hypothetical protein